MKNGRIGRVAAAVLMVGLACGSDRDASNDAVPVDEPAADGPADAAGTVLYVAPDGDDAGAGTIDQPLATLAGARDRVRTLDTSGGVTVFLRQGTYPVDTTVVFDERDSGTAGSPIVYASYPGETATFDGMRGLDASGFAPVSGPLTGGLAPEARGTAYSQVITDPELIALLSNDDAGLSYGDRMLRLSRFPDVGFAHVGRDLGGEAASGTGDYDAPLGAAFTVREAGDWAKYRAEIARDGRQAFILGYVSAPWFKEKLRIARVGDDDSLKLVDRSRYGFGNVRIERFAIKNVLYAMNAPGEWFFDELDQRLYIIPYDDDPTAAAIGVWAGPMAVQVDGAERIEFRRLVFQNLGQGRNGDAAIDVRRGASIRIEGCTFRMSIPDLLGRAAFFSDDYDGGDQYVENVCYKAGDEVIKMNKGSGHSVLRNVVVRSGRAIKLLGNDAQYAAGLTRAREFLTADPGSNAKENYVGRAELIVGDFASDAGDAYNRAWDTSFWATRYETLKWALRKSDRLGMYPNENRFYGNLFAGNRRNIEAPAGYFAERDSRDITMADFVDPAVLNLQFVDPPPPGAPVIPFAHIGLYTDDYRAAVPDKDDYRRKVKDRWEAYASYDDTTYDPDTINDRIYYNTGVLVVPPSQAGLSN